MDTTFDVGAHPFIAISGLIGAGKCWGADTPFTMFNGDIVPVHNIKEGQLLMGDDGTARKVLSTTRGFGPMFRIVPHVDHMDPFECNDAHILVLKADYDANNAVRHVNGSEPRFEVEYFARDEHTGTAKLETRVFKYVAGEVSSMAAARASALKFAQEKQVDHKNDELIWEVSVSDFLKASPAIRAMARMYRPEEVAFPERQGQFQGLLHDVLGAQPTRDQIRDAAWLIGVYMGGSHMEDELTRTVLDSTALSEENRFKRLLHMLNVHNGLSFEKLPAVMILDDIELVRLPFFAGLIDAHGHQSEINDGSFKFIHKKKDIVKDVHRLANTSGLSCSRVAEFECDTREKQWSTVITGFNNTEVPFKVVKQEKTSHIDATASSKMEWGFDVVPLSHGEYFGFMVDGNQRMLLGDLTVTHNSTLAEELGKVMNLPVFYEPVVDNAYLEDFYKDMRKYSFNLQIYLLNKRFQQHQQIIWSGRGGIADRSIYEDSIFAKMLADSGLMDKRDHETYKELFRNMSNFMRKPTLIVHLDVTPEQSLERIKMRGRDFESTVSLEYLRELRKGYDQFLEEISKSIPVIKVNYSKFRTAQEMAEVINREFEKLHAVRYVEFNDDGCEEGQPREGEKDNEEE